eukprot:gene2873-3463_t
MGDGTLAHSSCTEVRRMAFADLGAVNAVQCAAYPRWLREHPHTLLCKMVHAPLGCFVGTDQGTVASYLLTHPWMSALPPPALDTPWPDSCSPAGVQDEPALPDSLHIHDMAVSTEYQGRGWARCLFQQAYLLAISEGFATLCLVSVNDAVPFWRRLGFQATEPSEETLRTLNTYGNGALYMYLPISPTGPQPFGSGLLLPSPLPCPTPVPDSSHIVSSVPDAANTLPESAVDVIIVGAGLSGLWTACLLKRQGMTVSVLEASHRVGGRLKAYQGAKEGVRDMCGQWVEPQQKRVNALIQELGLRTTPQYDDSQYRLVIITEGSRCEYDPKDELVVYPEAFSTCLAELNKLGGMLPSEGPGLFSHPMVSMLYWLRYMRNAKDAQSQAQGCHEHLSLTKQHKIEGGAWGLADLLHRRELQDNVVFDTKVTKIYDHQTQATQA